MCAPLLEVGQLRDRLVAAMTTARELLQGLSTGELLAGVIDDAGTVDALCAVSTRHRHIGFLIPNEPAREVVAAAATAAGFAINHASFPSTIMTRELGALLGRRRVPTTIFKGALRDSVGAWLAVETFLPEEDPDVVAGWIRDGVGAHFGFGVPDSRSVQRALDLCLAAGLSLPPVMDGGPLSNPAEDVVACYADRVGPEGRARIEFLHLASAPAQ